MTEAEYLAAFERLSLERDPARFLSGLKNLRLAPEWERFSRIGAIRRQFTRLYARAKRQGLLEPSPYAVCACGHAFEWHEHGLACQSCAACSTFRPDGEPKPSRRSPPSKRREGPFEKHWKYGSETAMQLLAIEHRDKERARKGIETPNPWEKRIQERKAETGSRLTVGEELPVKVERCPPGASIHLRGSKK